MNTLGWYSQYSNEAKHKSYFQEEFVKNQNSIQQKLFLEKKDYFNQDGLLGDNDMDIALEECKSGNISKVDMLNIKEWEQAQNSTVPVMNTEEDILKQTHHLDVKFSIKEYNNIDNHQDSNQLSFPKRDILTNSPIQSPNKRNISYSYDRQMFDKIDLFQHYLLQQFQSHIFKCILKSNLLSVNSKYSDLQAIPTNIVNGKKLSKFQISDISIGKRNSAKQTTFQNQTLVTTTKKQNKIDLMEQEKNHLLARQIINKVLQKSENRKSRIKDQVQEFVENLKFRSKQRNIDQKVQDQVNFIDKIKDKAYFLNQSKNNQIFSRLSCLSRYYKNKLEIQVFLPTSMFQIAWDIMMVVSTTLFLYLYSIVIFFSFDSEESEAIRYSQNVFWVVFLLDIFVNFNTAYFNKDIIVTDRRLIAKKYFTSYFLTDLSSFSLLFWKVFILRQSLTHNPDHKILPILQNLIVFLKIFCIVSKKRKVEDMINLSGTKKLFLRLIYQIGLTIFAAHLVSIIWHALAIIEDHSDFQITWMKKINIDQSPYFIKYIYSLYWAVTTMATSKITTSFYSIYQFFLRLSITSLIVKKFHPSFSKDNLLKYFIYSNLILNLLVGYGDITPTNEYEALFTTITMIFLSVVFAYSINNIGMILQELEKESFQLKENISIIQRQLALIYCNKFILIFINVCVQGFQLISRVKQYLMFLAVEQRDRNKCNEDAIFSLLSNQLRDEITNEINSQIINQYPQFCSIFSQQTLQKIVFAMKEVLIYPNEVIFNQNEIDDCSIYFIQGGKIEIFCQNNNAIQVLKTLNKNELFGDISFFSGLARKASARSLNLSTLYKLSRNDLIDIIKENSQDFEKFKMIQDQIVLQNNYCYLNIQCYTCQQKNHISQKCPYTNQQFDSQFIILKSIYSVNQVREDTKRKSRIKYHPRLFFKKQIGLNLNETVWEFDSNILVFDLLQPLKLLKQQRNKKVIDNNVEIREDLKNNFDYMNYIEQYLFYTDFEDFENIESGHSSQQEESIQSSKNEDILQESYRLDQKIMKVDSMQENNKIDEEDITKSKEIQENVYILDTSLLDKFHSQEKKQKLNQQKVESSIIKIKQNSQDIKKQIQIKLPISEKKISRNLSKKSSLVSPSLKEKDKKLLQVDLMHTTSLEDSDLTKEILNQSQNITKLQQQNPRQNYLNLQSNDELKNLYTKQENRSIYSKQDLESKSNQGSIKELSSDTPLFSTLDSQKKSKMSFHKVQSKQYQQQISNNDPNSINFDERQLSNIQRVQLDNKQIKEDRKFNQPRRQKSTLDQILNKKFSNQNLIKKLLSLISVERNSEEGIQNLFERDPNSQINIENDFDRIKNFKYYLIHNNFEKIMLENKKKNKIQNIQLKEYYNKRRFSTEKARRDNILGRSAKHIQAIQDLNMTYYQFHYGFSLRQPTSLAYGVGIKGDKVYPKKYE